MNRLFLLEEAVSQDQFSKSAMYSELCRTEADDTLHCIGGRFATPWGDGFLGVHRARSQESFDEQDLDRLRQHTETIGRVLKLDGELAAGRRNEKRAGDAHDTLARAISRAVHLLSHKEELSGSEYALSHGNTLVGRSTSDNPKEGEP